MSSSIAITVGESLAKGALGQVGGLALGQILVLVGADISGQQEMSRKLDQILADLAVLRTAVDRLTADLQKVGADLAYDFSVNGVLGLIAVNTTLNGAFKSLLIAKPAEQQKLKGSIATELAKLTTGLATWDNCLRGISGQTGLINGWGRKVRANCADWFSPVSALAIESHWDYFDAQQALTVAYLVEFYNQNDEPTMAKNTLETWSQNRKLQLSMLRGTLRREEKVINSWVDVHIEPGKELLINLGTSELPVKNPNSTLLTVAVPSWTTMPLSFLPPNTAIHISSSTMWCLKIGGEVSANSIENFGDKKITFHEIYPSIVDITGVHDGWTLQSYDKIRSTLFVKARVDEVSLFHDGLSSLEFIFAPHGPARINLWTLDYARVFLDDDHRTRVYLVSRKYKAAGWVGLALGGTGQHGKYFGRTQC